MRITDAAHLGLMLAALALTYLVPFELLLLAYVVLGPAHYATEISCCMTASTSCRSAASRSALPASPSSRC